MNKKTIGLLAVIALLVSAVAYMYIPLMAQPGDANDPLVTRRYVDDRISQLEEEIAILRHLITGLPPGHTLPGTAVGTPGIGMPQAERDALFNEFMVHFEALYGNMIRAAANITMPEPTVVPFEVLNVPAGTVMVFEAGVEFILRAGEATVIAGPNGIADVTAGRDIHNGQAIGRNHLMLVPVTDGRGALFSTDAWVMIKGRYQIVN